VLQKNGTLASRFREVRRNCLDGLPAKGRVAELEAIRDEQQR